MWENRYEVITAADRPITTKFGKQMQNNMPMTIHTSVQFLLQYIGLKIIPTIVAHITG